MLYGGEDRRQLSTDSGTRPDLIAFSAALSKKARALANGIWDLEPADASDYIKREYLSDLTQSQHRAIVCLSVLAELETAVPFRLCDAVAVRRFINQGLLLSTDHDLGDVSLQLVHHGIGNLLLASLSSVDRTHVFSEIALKDTEFGMRIVRNLWACDRQQESCDLLAKILDSTAWFSPAFCPPALPDTIALLARVGNWQPVVIEARLLEKLPELIESALRMPPSRLMSVLKRVTPTLPRLRGYLLEALLADENFAKVRDLAFAEPLIGFTSFLRGANSLLPPIAVGLAMDVAGNTDRRLKEWLRTSKLFAVVGLLRFAKAEFPGLFRRMLASLESSENRDIVWQAALRANLDELVFFLRFAHRDAENTFSFLIRKFQSPETCVLLAATCVRSRPDRVRSLLAFTEQHAKNLYASICDALDSEPRAMLMTYTAQMNLDTLTSFLELSVQSLPRVYEVAAQMLEEQETLSMLAFSARRGALAGLTRFMRFAATRLEVVYQYLRARLLEGDCIDDLGELLSVSSLHVVLSFLGEQQLAKAVCGEIALARWRERWTKEQKLDVSLVPAVINAFAGLGRIELGMEVARASIVLARIDDWSRPNVRLTTLSHVLRASRYVSAGELGRFLQVVATREWLVTRYRELYPGPLSGALFGIWLHLDSARLEPFANPYMLALIKRKIERALTDDLTGFRAMISLMGTASLLGLDAPPLLRDHPSGARLIVALEAELEDAVATSQAFRLRPFLLGLRLVIKYYGLQVRLRNDVGGAILRALQATPLEAVEKLRQLDYAMGLWLKCCEKSRWRLEP